MHKNAALFFVASLLVTTTAFGLAKPISESRVALETYDVDLFLDGRVRQEFFYFDRVSSLRDDFLDTYHFIRNKANLGAYAECGRHAFKGTPAAQAQLRFCAYNYWDHPTQYAKISEENTVLNKGQFRDEIVMGSEHQHYGTIPMIYQDEAWINIDFDTFLPETQVPFSFKIGYFPYKVGRGVSLGDYHDGSISFMGWQDRTCESNATQSPPGILLTAEFSPSLQAELYYSKWRSYSTTPTATRAPTLAPLLDVDPQSIDSKDISRGTKADRELFAARLLIDGSGKGITWHLQPYAVYVHAPEQKIEVLDDASTKLGTIGLMAEVGGGPWQVNVEAAAQFGHQDMHAIDRLSQEVERDATTGALTAVYSHLLIEDTVTTAHSDKQPVLDMIAAAAYHPINRNRDTPKNYAVRGVDGTELSVDGKKVITASYPFLGKSRFRKEYRIEYGGFAVMADAKYTMPSGKLSIGGAAAWISGDAYPYNSEENKTYCGFMPLRDQNYNGYFVRSQALLHARKFPRPLDMADHKLYAFNHDEDSANLAFVGLGAHWHPCADQKKVTISPSLFAFWVDEAPHKWDKTASRDFGDAIDNAVYSACQTKLGFSGAATTEKASSFLGIETTLCLKWQMMEACSFKLGASAFFPGQLYRDIDGMPNRNTRRVLPNGSLSYDSLGSDVIMGLLARCTFAF